MRAGVVIAGGGLAAQRVAAALRAGGWEGPIRMVCAESVPPYDRPPLSKGLLAGSCEAEALALRPAAWYAEQAVELRLGRRAIGLSARHRRLRLDSGETLPYEHLVIATGAAPRGLPDTGRFANVHGLRTVDDAARLRAELRPGARLVVVGAGLIGMEVAATARGLGVDVALVEAASAPLLPVLGPALGAWLAGTHREAGVDVHLSTGVAALHGPGARAEAVELADGRRLACDAVLVGIGVAPATGWLAGSGLETDGVRVEQSGRTALAGVYAAGDAARPFDPRRRAHVRSDHWEAAVRQAAAVAAAILGRPPRPSPPPSFWSDQYGVRLQHVGDPAGADAVAIDGDPAARDFTAVWTARGRPVAALLVDRPHELPALRRRIAGAAPDERMAA